MPRRFLRSMLVALAAVAAVVALAALLLIGSREAAGPAPRPFDKASAAAREPSTEVRYETQSAGNDDDRRYARERAEMVERQLQGRDITDARVLDAMRTVPRHRFVPEASRDRSYDDRPLAIGHDQTISQPYIVALTTQLAHVAPEARVLDVGTGSGYQAAVLAEMGARVYSIEIVCDLAETARERLRSLGYDNIEVRCGDGYRGWPDAAPFDAIVVAAAAGHLPQPLIDQLAPGGRLIIPIGRENQQLLMVEKNRDGTIRQTPVAGVLFVPMTGEAQSRAR
ncbi:MAG: protein-L-isoaspartate(D-aspartate) O-methyltransferase [Planctomycetaceae bacterium]